MSNPARARRLVSALLQTEGCTAEEAALRTAKARQLAGAAGIRHEWPQLATPEDHALRAARYHSLRARGLRPRVQAPPPPSPQQRSAELVQIMIEIIQRLAAERRLAERRRRRWEGRFP